MDCPSYEHWLTRLAPGREGTPRASPDNGRCLSNGVMTECERLLEIHEKVKETGSPNFESAKIPIKSRWDIDYMRRHLSGYHDQMVATLCEYGWLIGITDSENLDRQSIKNHSGAHEVPDQMDEYIARELGEGTLLGPFKTNSFRLPMVVSPLNTTEKRDSSERWVIMDLSLPPGQSVHDRIPKDSYLEEATGLRYLSVDALTKLVREKGPGCALMKCDLKRAYRQIFVDPRELLMAAVVRKIVFWCDNAYGSEVGGNVLSEAH